MAQEIKTTRYTVKWFMADKKLIKFNESSEDFTLSETVAKIDHTKYGIKAGVKVDIAVDLVKKVVNYIRKAENEEAAKPEANQPPKEEPKAEAPKSIPAPTDTGEVFTWIVSGLPESRK